MIEKRRVENEKPYELPSNLKFKAEIVKENYYGMEVFYLNRKKEANNRQILYLHGGAYINQPVRQHWAFLDDVFRNTNATVIVPIYPKAPNHQYKESFEKVFAIYENLLSITNCDNITIMGYSAGGGFALALSQLLLEKGLPQPRNIILLSPWLDITMQNPEISALEDKDHMLGANGLIQMGMVWAGDLDRSNFMLSPINGEVLGLVKISLFVGTHELFLPDARKFRDMAEAERRKINYFEYASMNHVFLVYPIPDGKKAKNKIIDIINEK